MTDAVLRHPYFGGKRIVLGTFGAIFIAVALYAASPRVWQAPWSIALTLEVVPLAMGLFLVTGALFEREDEWRIHGREVIVRRSNVFTTTDLRLHATDVTSAVIIEHDWETRPKTYDVRITTSSGLQLTTPERSSRAAAEHDLGLINAGLGR